MKRLPIDDEDGEPGYGSDSEENAWAPYEFCDVVTRKIFILRFCEANHYYYTLSAYAVK